MIFSLVQDFADALAAMPREHPRYRILSLLDEAIRRDVHFIDRHPTTFFQCMWNSCWWYDCPKAAEHYGPPDGGWPPEGPPWQRSGPFLYKLLESWQKLRQELWQETPRVDSTAPPEVPLGTAQWAILRGHQETVLRLSFSADGTRLATGGFDSTVRVWDAKTGEELGCFKATGRVTGVALSPDGARLAFRTFSDMSVWDLDSRECLLHLPVADQRFRGIAFVTRDRFVYATGATVWLHDLNWPKRLVDLILERHLMNEKQVDPPTWDEEVSLRPIEDGSQELAVWMVGPNEELIALGGHRDEVTGIAISPDGRRLATSSLDATVRVWDTETWRPMAYLRVSGFMEADNLLGVCFSPDGQRVAAVGHHQHRYAWNLSTGERLGTDDLFASEQSIYFLPKGPHWSLLQALEIKSFAASRDGRFLAAATDDHSVRLFEIGRGDPPPRFLSGLKPTAPTAASVTGTYVRFNLSYRVDFFRADRERSLLLQPIVCEPAKLVVSPDDWRIVTVPGDHQAETPKLWDANDGRFLGCLGGHAGPLQLIQFSPEGSRLVTAANDDRPVRLWAADTGYFLCELTGHKLRSGELSFSPNGERLVTIPAAYGNPRLWDTTQGRLVATLQDHESIVEQVQFSRDGLRLLTLAGAGRFEPSAPRLWDATTGDLVAALTGDDSVVVLAAFSSGGQYLVTAAEDGRVRLWEGQTGAPLRTVGRSESVPASIAFSEDGESIVTTQATGEVQSWDINDTEPPSPAADVWYYSPDRRQAIGPVAAIQLKQLIESGKLPRDALVSRDKKKWYAATKLRGAKWPD